ncbi:hypothetical protein ACX8Z9_02870 [Arthrobacter halodurans]|uniref:Uncharacterized protein n=1 Tax=Arthrobacter halodurans TaxID=516699 RepID=A0ABV4ULD1_9MICC
MALAVLESKAAEYRQVRRLRQLELGLAAVTMSKSGMIIEGDVLGGERVKQAANQILVQASPENRQVSYQGYTCRCRRRSPDGRCPVPVSFQNGAGATYHQNWLQRTMCA